MWLSLALAGTPKRDSSTPPITGRAPAGSRSRSASDKNDAKRRTTETKMTETDNAANATAMPTLHVVAQYTKDLSFENPGAPASLAPSSQPQINIQINVNARPVKDGEFEVELKIEAKAEAKNQLLFAVELLYAGIFRAQNVAQETLHAFVMIECPRMLFPFARQIVADTVRNGGFPPLMIDPVDFVSLYRQRMAKQAPAAAVLSS
jgi:preprotein translocase subunit SecB